MERPKDRNSSRLEEQPRVGVIKGNKCNKYELTADLFF